MFLHNMDRRILSEKTRPMLSHVNVGSGSDLTIKELAETVKMVVGFAGNLVFDLSKPDGTPRKLMDVDLLTQLGWSSRTSLIAGLKKSYRDFCLNIQEP